MIFAWGRIPRKLKNANWTLNSEFQRNPLQHKTTNLISQPKTFVRKVNSSLFFWGSTNQQIWAGIIIQFTTPICKTSKNAAEPPKKKLGKKVCWAIKPQTERIPFFRNFQRVTLKDLKTSGSEIENLCFFKQISSASKKVMLR